MTAAAAAKPPSGINIIDTIDKQLKISDVEHAFKAATKTECKQQMAQRKPLSKLSSSSSTTWLAQHSWSSENP